MIKLSVVIITFNEEKNIERCLLSVKDIADEIVVIDSLSTDNTETICRKHNVNFYQNKFEGYSSQKNFANSKAANNYILSLDADEALSEELTKSITEVKNNPLYSVYYTNRLSSYCGKWIKYGGWYPDIQYRLFDKRKTKWNNNLVHEKIEFNKQTTIGFLKGNLLHYTINTQKEHLNVINKYSSLKATEMLKKGRKTSLMKIYFATIFKFINHYIIKLGFLDGYYGYIIAKNSAYSSYLKYYKLRQLIKNE